MAASVDRSDPTVARRIVERLFEDPGERVAALKLFAEGVQHAHQLGPHAGR
jgi:hypothetical protein